MDNTDVRSGWIKLANERNDKILKITQEAKWILKFPKGNEDINTAWKILVDLVVNDTLWDIKAAAKSDMFDSQIICVYVKDDKDMNEIILTYDVLLKNGLIDLHMKQKTNNNIINFTTDESTRLHGSKPSFTNEDISDLHKVYELHGTVNTESYNKRFNEFTFILNEKLAGNPLPQDFIRSYFSQNETNSRYELLLKIDGAQKNQLTADLPVLDDIILNIRSALTSNYKFNTLEILNHGIALLVDAQPKKGFFESIFNQNPDDIKYSNVIIFLKQLCKEEQIRLSQEARFEYKFQLK